MSDYIQMDADEVKRHIEALFAAYPEIEEDEELRIGVIEGETRIDKVIERAISAKMDADIIVSGIADVVSSLSERSQRFERQSDAMRSLIRSLMRAANIPKLQLATATVSISKGRRSVVITDESAIPSQLTVTKVTPDKAAIAAQLNLGEDVPGAELVTGPETLIMRVK